jgi:poly-gamma-glutamate capsule biosynthesis protein CapA/YwtB (metallophosphatase superfamily)
MQLPSLMKNSVQKSSLKRRATQPAVSLFLCGDVMTGRGIDQILPYPGDPVIYEPYMKSAAGYVEIAEQANGPIARPVDFAYIWGDALAELEQMAPDVRLINLETAVTAGNDYWKGKGINYRMNPKNIPGITVAGIDCCSLANNHVLDWGYSGLAETLAALKNVGLKTAGVGRNLDEAQAPAFIPIANKARVIVYAFGSETSGIPPVWAASVERAGVNFLKDLSFETVDGLREKILKTRRPGDIVAASIHWGGNWGYRIPPGQIEFAHNLIDHAGVDVVHGHSSHHVKGIEVYKQKPILYGCGDFLNDYEGIKGHEAFRDDLGLMYFLRLNPADGTLAGLQMIPTRINNFRVNRATAGEARWLQGVLSREGRKLGTRVKMDSALTLDLQWD